MNSKQLIKLLETNGWQLVRSGKHLIYEKDGTGIPVPYHGTKDLPIGTLNSILKRAGLKK
jgi:mRNA interferase HicA